MLLIRRTVPSARVDKLNSAHPKTQDFYYKFCFIDHNRIKKEYLYCYGTKYSVQSAHFDIIFTFLGPLLPLWFPSFI